MANEIQSFIFPKKKFTKKEAEDAVKDLIDQLWDGYVVAKP